MTFRTWPTFDLHTWSKKNGQRPCFQCRWTCRAHVPQKKNQLKWGTFFVVMFPPPGARCSPNPPIFHCLPSSIAYQPSFKWKRYIFEMNFVSQVELIFIRFVRWGSHVNRQNQSFCALVLSLDRHDILYIFHLRQLAPHRFQKSFACLAKFGQVPFALATSTSWNSFQFSCNQPCVLVPETPTSHLPPQTHSYFMQINSVRSVASTMRARSRNFHIPGRPTGYLNLNSKRAELTHVAPQNIPKPVRTCIRRKIYAALHFDMPDWAFSAAGKTILGDWHGSYLDVESPSLNPTLRKKKTTVTTKSLPYGFTI